jgi:hypothetical protein
MNHSKWGVRIFVSLVAWFAAYACSASTGSYSSDDPALRNAGGAAPTGVAGGGSAGRSTTANEASGGEMVFFPGSGGMGGSGSGAAGADSGCPAIKQHVETFTTYKDASVTDTITTLEPVALFIMQDRTGSMVTGIPSGCACSWGNSTTALTQCVNDPASAGLDVGLSFFGGSDKTACDGSDCGQPVVPIGPVSQTGARIVSAMQGNAPNPANITPLECGLRGMINACLQFMSQSPKGERCVAVLVTDGNTMDPTPCDGNVSDLVQIVTDGKSKGVTTFTLGLQGSDPNFLNQLALAGGSNMSIDASNGPQAFVAALNSIRQAVTMSITTPIRTPITIATPLPCEWAIPPPPAGTTFDKGKVNVQFVPQGGGAPVKFGFVKDAADCARAAGDAWYYDDDDKPTKVLACPNTCSSTLHGSAGAEVDLLFGCETEQVPIH